MWSGARATRRLRSGWPLRSISSARTPSPHLPPSHGLTLGPMSFRIGEEPLSTDLTGEVVDAREFAPPSDPDGTPTATDRALCDATPSGSPFAGKIVLVFKTYLSSGDCYADDKALHAQEAGATGVILWDGGGGSLPSQWAPNTSISP